MYAPGQTSGQRERCPGGVAGAGMGSNGDRSDFGAGASHMEELMVSYWMTRSCLVQRLTHAS